MLGFAHQQCGVEQQSSVWLKHQNITAMFTDRGRDQEHSSACAWHKRGIVHHCNTMQPSATYSLPTLEVYAWMQQLQNIKLLKRRMPLKDTATNGYVNHGRLHKRLIKDQCHGMTNVAHCLQGMNET